MRWNAVCLFTSVLIMVSVGGCKLFDKNAAMEPVVGAPDSFVAQAQETSYGADPYSANGSVFPVEDSYESSAPLAGSELRYHTVARHDTLYGLARAYYSDHHRWKEIYEANRATIADPNKIRVGQRLLIP